MKRLYRSRTIFWSIRGTAKKSQGHGHHLLRVLPGHATRATWRRFYYDDKTGGGPGKRMWFRKMGSLPRNMWIHDLYKMILVLQDCKGDFCKMIFVSQDFFSHDLTPSLRWFGQSKTEDVNSEWQQDSVRCSHPSLTASLKQLLLQPHATNTLWWAWARKDPPFVDERFIEHWLDGGLEHLVIFPYIGNFMIPTDELIFFRGVVLPATRLS